jgi:acetoin utilization protein AcuB
MLVRDIMQADPVSATRQTRLPDLLRLLERRGFRHLPVVDAGKLVGIVSDRDLKQAMVSAASMTEGRERERLFDQLTAGQVMTRAVVTTGPTCGVEEAARVMTTRKISALPVTEGDRLVGIVTETDVLQLFVRAMGVLEPSSRLDVILRDPAAGVGPVVRTVEETGARISSMMTLETPGGEREVVLRIATINPGPAVKALVAGGYVVRDGDRGAPAPS